MKTAILAFAVVAGLVATFAAFQKADAYQCTTTCTRYGNTTTCSKNCF